MKKQGTCNWAWQVDYGKESGKWTVGTKKIQGGNKKLNMNHETYSFARTMMYVLTF